MAKKLTLEYVLDVVKKLGHKPLFNKPVVNRDTIECECKIHGKFTVKVGNLLSAYRKGKGNGCRKCGDMTNISLQDVKDKFATLNLTPLFEEYHNCKEKLPFICNNHPELGVQYTRYHLLKKGVLRPCKKCSSENLSKKHTQPFKIKRIDDPRRKTTDYKKWREIILNIFHKTCVRCGSNKNIRVHHIEPVKLYPDKIIYPTNGVTLCEECHKEYHKKFKLSDKQINHKESLMKFILDFNFMPNWIVKDTKDLILEE